ncbi:MAG: ABC transporter permease [Bacteroidales bacterium]|nr:ABC transporter permease [Bacteroidales bacterium]
MNIQHLITKSIFRYKSFYRLIAIAVIVAVAVIVGSLVVGDSVRNTLVKRVDERLGKTETIIFSRYSYLNEKIIDLLNVWAGSARPSSEIVINDYRGGQTPPLPHRGILLMNGFVSVSGKLTPVMVWGVDDLGIERGKTKINRALYNEITVETHGRASLQSQHLVLRLPSAGMVPLGSMFVTDAYTTSLRLEFSDIISVEQGGNISLKNEQTIPFNIFANREELAEIMGVSRKINVILSDQIISKEDFALAWNYGLSGLNVASDPLSHRTLSGVEGHGAIITSERIFIQDKVVETLTKDDPFANRIFTYLANSIRKNEKSIPYSFITAVDFFNGQFLNPNEIILSDYAARRLNARLGDTISISYFVSKQFKTLIEDSVFFRVSKIVPIADLQKNQSLKADFPGLSNVERCTDWNSDLPINMSLITNEDEDFWRTYKNTPKAIVPYSTLAPRWKNAFGSATALQISDTSRLNDLTFEMFDIRLIYPRETAIVAAKSGVDFSTLFLSLGFFIIISAAMLMIVPLSEMLFRRRDELKLLKAIGFSNKRILRLLWREANPVVWISAIGGVIVGLLYTYLVLFLLGTVWKGATHTEGFQMFPEFSTIFIGLISGVVLSLMILYFSIREGTKSFRLRSTTRQVAERSRSHISRFNLSKLIRASILHNKKQALLSFVTLACGVLIVFSVGLNRRGFADSSQIQTATGGFALWVETAVPVFHNLQTEEGRTKLGLTDLHEDVHIVQLLKYSADDASCLNLNRVVTPNVLGINMEDLKNSDFRITKTIAGADVHVRANNVDNNGTDYKSAPAKTVKQADVSTALRCARHDNAKREREGREGFGGFAAKSFSPSPLQNTVIPSGAHKVREVEESPCYNGVYPALVDETVLKWSLGKKLGDTLIYLGEKGDTILIQLVGTLENSIFQGSILIDKNLFSEIWSEISGSEIMLVNVPENEIEHTKTLLSQALNNYGVRVMSTNERMKLFYSVTDTYLTIFLTLGGLGLLLGIFSFIIVVRKNLLARTKEITLYRSLGFDEKQMFNLLYKENIIIPIFAIFTGVLGSFIGVIMGFGNVSVGVWMLAVVFLVSLIFCVMVFVKTSVKKALL